MPTLFTHYTKTWCVCVYPGVYWDGMYILYEKFISGIYIPFNGNFMMVNFDFVPCEWDKIKIHHRSISVSTSTC